MANIPVDGNYQSLLSTRIGNKNPQRYFNYNLPSYSNLYSVMTKEIDRVLYLFIFYRKTVGGDTYALYKYTSFNSTVTLLWERSSNNFGYILDFVLDNNDKMYLSVNSEKFLWVIDLSNASESKWNYTTNKNPICLGKLEWINEESFIMFDAGPNLLTFNVADFSITTASMSGGSTSGNDYCIGKKYIFTTHTKYDIENQTASTYRLPNNSNPTAVSYDNGRYYFAMSNILYYYDEATDTWSSEIAVGWTTPIELCVYNNICYAANNNSNKAYLYDLNKNVISSFLFAWKVPGRGASSMTRADMFQGMWMISRDTLCYIMYDADLKYNAGPIAQHVRLTYNISTESNYEFDERFVKFTDTYMTIEDGFITYPDINRGLVIETIDENRGIYGISVSKDDYNIFKELKM